MHHPARTPLAGLLLLASAALAPLPASAAESYDNCTGFVDALPAVISTQGTWCLRHDLSTAIASGAAITINANNVTLDCNHFKVGGLAAGNGSDALGLYAHTRSNITVRNCSVRGFAEGLYLFGSGHVVEHNRFDNNLFRAIGVFGDGNRIVDNLVVDTGGREGFANAVGIEASASIIDNTVDGVFGVGANTYPTGISLYSGSGHLVRGNQISDLLAAGAGVARGIFNEGAGGVAIDRNHITSVGFGGIGIDNDGGAVFCTGNTIHNFSTPTQDCTSVSGNLSLP